MSMFPYYTRFHSKFLNCFLFFISLYFIVLNFSSHNKDTCDSTDSLVPEAGLLPDKSWKKILIATSYWWIYKTWYKILIRHFEGKCSEVRCIFHTNLSDASNADAILFNAPNLPSKSLLTPNPMAFLIRSRNPNQIWVLMSAEPPANIYNNVNLTSYNGYFNWTMTYRRDSDVFMPYGVVIRKEIPDHESTTESLIPSDPLHDKLVTWMASRCVSQSKREDFVVELKKFINVDVFGSCGQTCGFRTTIPNVVPGWQDPCEKMLQNYYFYLALENDICKDYITEKFYRALKIGLIPVVMGGEGLYDEVAPPNSVVNIEDFASVGDLAKHLVEIANNRTLFLNYHEWRREYKIEIGHPFSPMVCGLCSKLHSNYGKKHVDRQWFVNIYAGYALNYQFVHCRRIERKVYHDLYSWAVERSKCRQLNMKKNIA